MFRAMCKSKIHRATVIAANLNYVGSPKDPGDLTLDAALMEAADLLPYEQVQVVHVNNGAHFETYLIAGERDSGEVCLNGAAARLGAPGDKVIIISYAMMSEEEARGHEPVVVHVDEVNARR